MPSRVDEMIDRRRLRRKLTFWRVVALVIAAVAIIGVAQFAAVGVGEDHIARIRIEGTITEDESPRHN
jgi:protease-4